MKKPCSVDRCKNLARTRGLCPNHYHRLLRNGHPIKSPRDELRATRSPTTVDLHWAAGFLEGEGHFGCNSPTARCAVVKAAQVQKEPLDRLRAIFGGRISFCESRKPKQRDSFVWQISGARARGVMMTLYSLLSTCRQRAIERALKVGLVHYELAGR